MYIPKSFAETDAHVLYEFMRDNNFATLVTQVEGSLTATHLPVLVDSERGVVRSHMARANEQWKAFDGREVLVVFQGPHTYISPTLYETHPSVPTWNYAAVHVYGVPYIVDDEQAVRTMLRELVETHERGREPEWKMELPEDFMQNRIQALVAFEVPIDRIEGKFKLSQNRSLTDASHVASALLESSSDVERALGDLMVNVNKKRTQR